MQKSCRNDIGTERKLLEEAWTEEQPVGLADMLTAREQRAHKQAQLLQASPGMTLVCFTMNIAGPIKNNPLIEKGFQRGLALLKQAFSSHDMAVLFSKTYSAKTGNEAFFLLPDEARTVKQVTCSVEESSALGRLFDIDVIRPDGTKVSREEIGFPERPCMICGRPGRICASRRTHSVEELQAYTKNCLVESLLQGSENENS